MAQTTTVLTQALNRLVGGKKGAKNNRVQETTAQEKVMPTEIMPTPAEGDANLISGKELLVTKVQLAGMPTTLSQVDMMGLNDQERKALVSEIRREYQRQYYQKHKEKAKEYQRQYNLTHKKKARGGRGKASFECPRETVRSTFNTADLMHSPVEKTIKMLEKIVNGERLFTM